MFELLPNHMQTYTESELKSFLAYPNRNSGNLNEVMTRNIVISEKIDIPAFRMARHFQLQLLNIFF